MSTIAPIYSTAIPTDSPSSPSSTPTLTPQLAPVAPDGSCSDEEMSFMIHQVDSMHVPYSMASFKVIANLTISTIGLPLNLVLACLVVYLLRKHYLSWKKFYLILNNTVMDIVACLVILASSCTQLLATEELSWLPGPRRHDIIQLRRIYEGAEYTVIHVAAINYACFSLLQFTAVRWPLYHATNVTPRTCRAILLINWGLVALSASVFYFTFLHLPTLHAGAITGVVLGYALLHVVTLVILVVLICGTYGIAIWSTKHRLVNHPDTPPPVDRRAKIKVCSFVRGLAIRLFIYALTAGILFSSELASTLYTLAIVKVGPFFQDGYFFCGRVDQFMGMMNRINVLHIIYEITTPIWLARMIMEPLMHLLNNPVLRMAISCRRIHSMDTALVRGGMLMPQSDWMTASTRVHRSSTNCSSMQQASWKFRRNPERGCRSLIQMNPFRSSTTANNDNVSSARRQQTLKELETGQNGQQQSKSRFSYPHFGLSSEYKQLTGRALRRLPEITAQPNHNVESPPIGIDNNQPYSAQTVSITNPTTRKSNSCDSQNPQQSPQPAMSRFCRPRFLIRAATNRATQPQPRQRTISASTTSSSLPLDSSPPPFLDEGREPTTPIWLANEVCTAIGNDLTRKSSEQLHFETRLEAQPSSLEGLDGSPNRRIEEPRHRVPVVFTMHAATSDDEFQSADSIDV